MEFWSPEPIFHGILVPRTNFPVTEPSQGAQDGIITESTEVPQQALDDSMTTATEESRNMILEEP